MRSTAITAGQIVIVLVVAPLFSAGVFFLILLAMALVNTAFLIASVTEQRRATQVTAKILKREVEADVSLYHLYFEFEGTSYEIIRESSKIDALANDGVRLNVDINSPVNSDIRPDPILLTGAAIFRILLLALVALVKWRS